MSEVLQNALLPYILPYTLFLGLVIVYWLFVIFGAMDIDIFEFDLDADIEIEGGHSFFRGLLSFCNIGSVPLTIIISLISLQMWVGAMSLDHYQVHGLIVNIPFWLFQVFSFILILLLSVLITALLTRPLNRFFTIKSELKNQDLVGKVCNVTTSKVTEIFGGAEFETNGSPINISIRNKDNEEFKRGDQAIITHYDEKNNLYFVKRFDI